MGVHKGKPCQLEENTQGSSMDLNSKTLGTGLISSTAITPPSYIKPLALLSELLFGIALAWVIVGIQASCLIIALVWNHSETSSFFQALQPIAGLGDDLTRAWESV